MTRLPSFRIGPWTISPTESLIEGAAGASRIQPRAMDVLVCLVEHAGEVVSVESLMAAVWRGRIVTNASVYQSIKMLRRALRDDGRSARYIQTVPKRGYRLIAAVEPSPAPEGPAARGAAGRPHRPRSGGPARIPARLGVGLLAAAVAVAAAFQWAARTPHPPGPVDASAFAAESAAAHPGARSPLAEALYLRAQTALKPLVSRFEPAQAVRLLDEAIAHDPGFASAYALKAYLIGADRVSEAMRLVDRALALDPDLGMAHMVRATLYEARWEGERARRAYRLALELSPDDAWILGRYAYFNSFTGHHQEAIRLATRLVALEPSSPESHRYLARAFLFAGRRDAAAAAMRRAAELDPIDPSMHLLLGLIEASRGHGDRAVQALRLAEELLPEPGGDILASVAYGYGLAGRRDEASRVLEQWERHADRRAGPMRYPIRYYLARGDYGRALERVQAAIDAGEPPNVPLLQIMTNLFSESRLEEPRFAAVRTQLRFRN